MNHIPHGDGPGASGGSVVKPKSPGSTSRGAPTAPRVSTRHARAGFTAIEMLAVLGAVVVMLGMAGIAVVPAVRKARVDRAAGAVVEVARHARRLAMQRTHPANDAHYGVVIATDPDTGETLVALTFGHPGDGKGTARERILRNAAGAPIMAHVLPATVRVWHQDEPLAEREEIAWYVQYRTGLPLAAEGLGLGSTAAEVGTVPRRHERDFDDDSAVVAPGDGEHPGLSLRSADDRIRRSLAIYVSGIPMMERF